MSVVSATQVTIFTAITATVGTIISKELIETAQERLLLITNNYFTSDIVYVSSPVTFNATARSIILSGTNKWEEFGFKANDDMMIYRSIRNDKIVSIASISDSTAVLTSACSVIDESYSTNDGPTVIFSLVQWPKDIQHIVCDMIYFDYDIRPKTGYNASAVSLGPWSEKYTTDSDRFGYPDSILSRLDKYTIARLS